ncbi:hypothetical protein STEG23_031451 [Scotinomys teguina]
MFPLLFLEQSTGSRVSLPGPTTLHTQPSSRRSLPLARFPEARGTDDCPSFPLNLSVKCLDMGLYPGNSDHDKEPELVPAF